MKTRLMSVIMAAACLGWSGAGHAAESRGPGGTLLSASEVYKLYKDRTWLWDKGAGHFAADRRFTAWSGDGASASYADGRWLVTDKGRMCFSAYWNFRGGEKPNVTCFGHRKVGRVIYQRKEPSGSWYVFRNSPSKRTDESAKLVPGDRVYDNLRRAAAAVAGT
jgi:Protein of unknown function (DUF995)